MSAKKLAQHAKYTYEKPKETVQVLSNWHNTSRTGTKKPEETEQALNDRNK